MTKEIFEGKVVREVEVKAWISSGWNLFRDTSEVRAAISAGGRMEWKWFGDEEKALQWLDQKLRYHGIKDHTKQEHGDLHPRLTV
jgi:hypothetical protein